MRSEITFLRWTLVFLGVAVRVQAARGPLWLDEIWSLNRAREASSPWQFALRIQHDNDHPLNSLWLSAIGEIEAPLMVRALSLVASLATLAVFTHWSRELRPLCGAALLGLAALSFPFVVYGSEARGYSVAILGVTMCAFGRTRPTLRGAPGSGWVLTGSVLALLGHATSVFALGALLARDISTRRLRRLLDHLPWLGIFALWVTLGLFNVAVGGGPEESAAGALVRFSEGVLGLRAGGYIGAVGILLLATCLVADWRASAWVVLCLLLATLGAGLGDYPHVHPRYFVVATPFLLVALIGLSQRTPRLSVVLLTVVAGLQVSPIHALLHHGRGDFPAVTDFLVRHARSMDRAPAVFIDHPFRVGTLLDHFGESGIKRYERFHPFAEYMLMHHVDDEPRFPDIHWQSGKPFALLKVWPSAPWTGMNVALYERVPPR